MKHAKKNTAPARAPAAATPPASQDRRASPRHAPASRAAVWFDFGPAIGETCELRDISLTGFSVRCNEWQRAALLAADGQALYSVLLLGEAHFGCMARVVASGAVHAGQVGFAFEAVPRDSQRLLEGLVHWMASRQEPDPLQLS